MTDTERIDRLERSNRRMKWGLMMATAIVVAACGLAGQSKGPSVAGVVLTKELRVVDDRQQTLVRIGSSENGRGMLSTYNGKGQELVKLTATTNGEGVLSTYNGKGQRLVKLTATTGGKGTLSTYNGKGQKLVKLGATTAGGGVLSTYNGEGQELGDN